MAEEQILDEQTTVNPRGKFIGFWANAELYERAKTDADQSGLTISDYLRELILGAPVPRKYRAPQASKIQVGKFLGHLGKIGSNINQLAHVANRAALVGNLNMMPHADEILSQCDRIEKLLLEIRSDVKAQIDKG